ncbi:MAG: adenosylcobinamide amidohydrolase [Methanoregula sp.]|nr:adenosylcobinamide amidohydrolase [Methanoregula sp.]
MRYYLDSSTLFVRGAFRAASTGASDSTRNVTTLLLHTVPAAFVPPGPQRELALVAAGAGIGNAYFGLLTEVPVQNLCVLQYDFVTVFISAGINDKPASATGTINIVICSSEGMDDSALHELIVVASEAKADALREAGYTSGSPTGAVIVACEGAVTHRNAGRNTEAGRRVEAAVKKGVPEALRHSYAGGNRSEPGFFIYSRFKGEHWVEWTQKDCQYYPCHFAGQRCDFCYCPFYPCHNERLGQWTNSSNGGRVWNCASCTLLHEPAGAEYLNKYPESSLKELVQLTKKQNR